MDADTIISEISKISQFDQVSLTPLQKPLTLDFYSDWLDAGLHGDMEYLARHLEPKKAPQQLLPKARSAIVVKKHYDGTFPWPRPMKVRHNKIARYARGHDYHIKLRQELEQVGLHLKTLFPQHSFLPMTDSSPVMERDLAFRSGMGWFGKNSCLISQRRGSYFLIGEIYTSLDLNTPRATSPDLCGSCTKCMDACPTQALVSPKKLDARRCISYWTIESSSIPPIELREQFSGWLFGCDICQEVCPWNLRFSKESGNFITSSHADVVAELKWILNSSNKGLQKALAGTALQRAAGKKLKRNAIIVAANLRLNELTENIETYLGHVELGSLAQWSLKKLQDSTGSFNP